jgi:CheY-like chemotaxis protein
MPTKIKILYIEDDHDDIEFMRMALTDADVVYELETIMRGDLAIKRIMNQKAIPDIIVMDLNIPKIHGREVIRHIRQAAHLNAVPVLVLTTSSLKEDVTYCLNEGADNFMTKPADTKGFSLLAKTIRKMAGRQRVPC